MALSCEINFDQNVDGVYFAGQLVSGSVVVNLPKNKKIKAICFRITGSAKCHWSENEVKGTGKDRTTRSVQFHGEEVYVSTSTYLLPGGLSGETELKSGSHRYTFACALPPMLPTSFEGTYGHIRYTAKVILERPWKFDHTYQRAFTVLKELNLNYMAPHLRIPSQMEFTKTFCCWPCRSDPLSIVVSLPQTGYVPGQVIALTADVNNASTTEVTSINYMLRKIITYYSEQPDRRHKIESTVITKYKDAGVGKQSSGTFQIYLTVPPVPATNNDNSCRVIHIAYDVTVEVKVSGVHENPTVTIPITIGTVPLTVNTMEPPREHHKGFESSMQDMGQPAFGQVLPSAPVIMTPTPDGTEFNGHPLNGIGGASVFPIPNMGHMAPPSYEETLNGSHQILDADDTHPISSHSYTPRYPVYHFNHGAELQQTTPAGPSHIQKY